MKSTSKTDFILALLDKLFLKVISSNTNYAPIIFFVFSKKVLDDTFVKFMIGKSNIFDYFKVVYAMPKKLFLKCLIKN